MVMASTNWSPRTLNRCPARSCPLWHASEADKLTKHLAELEILPPEDRNQQLDALVARYLDVPPRSTR